ncbi:hypothetical protein DL433_26965 [Escherichia coli]|nr:hypothetical protein [Escherichia coli]
MALMELLFVLSSLAAFFIRAKRKIVENVVPSAFNFLFNVDLLRYIFLILIPMSSSFLYQHK